MRAALLSVLVVLVGCASAPRPEPALIWGPITKRAVVLVMDPSLAAEGRATAKVVLDATLDLARGDEVATGVLAATADGARVLAPLGDRRAVSIEPTDDRVAVGKGCRRALDALIAAEAIRGSLVILLVPPLAGDDVPEVDRASREAASRGYRILRAPVEAGPRAALAEVAGEGFGYLLARGGAASITPQGGRVVAVGLAPLNVKTWNDLPRAKLELPKWTQLLFYRPAWTLELAKDAPPPIAFVGDPVPIALTISGPSALGLLVDVTARSLGRTLVLARGVGKNGLRFEGEADAPREEGPCEVAFALALTAGEAHFEQERSFRYLAKRREGTPPPTVTVTPSRIDLGAVWSDSRTEVKLRVKGDPDRPVKVLVESPFATAKELALVAGEEKDLAVTLDARSLAASDRLKLRAEVTLVATAPVRPVAKGERVVLEVPQQAPPRLLSVPVASDARSLRAPSSFELGKVLQGETVSRAFPIQGARVEARVVCDEDLGATAVIERDSLVVRATPKLGAPAGVRAGRIELTLAGSKSAPLVRALSIEVVPTPPRELALSVEPAVLQLKGRYGWAEGRVRVSANVAARLDAQPGALSSPTARIGPRRDIRVKAVDAGWDARSLVAGEERELVVRVYLGSDLPAGRYEGTLALEARDERKSVAKPLPVSVEVER